MKKNNSNENETDFHQSLNDIAHKADAAKAIANAKSRKEEQSFSHQVMKGASNFIRGPNVVSDTERREQKNRYEGEKKASKGYGKDLRNLLK